MVFIRWNTVDTNIGEVTYIHYKTEMLSAQDREGGMLIMGGVPEPEHVKGKQPVLKVKFLEKQLFYDYVDVPVTREQQLEERVSFLENALDEIIFGGVV